MIAALDFSINKTALSIFDKDILKEIYVFPLEIDKMSETKLTKSGVYVINRNLTHISRKSFNESTLILEQVNRACTLADLIADVIVTYAQENKIDYSDVIICNEGFSFGSKGAATLDLAGFKFVLMKTLIDSGFTKFVTYSPITIKATAGNARKGTTKLDMINSLSNLELNHPFIEVLRSHPEYLKKKTNFINCVDDIADSIWCGLTHIKNKDNQ